MSKHYEERYYVRDEIPAEYEEHRSSSRRRSTSRSRHRGPPASQEEHYYRQQRLTRSGSGSSISSISDYEYRNQCDRPLVRVPRDVIRAPTPPPVIQRVVERAPTPEPDIVERVIVRPQPQQLIERIIERPRTPPPKIIDKEISEPAPPPIVRTRIVKVDHSPRHYANNTPIRYVQPPRQGLCNYGPCPDYDYMGYDRSYSTSYSTTELFQPNGYPGAGGYGAQAYQAQAPPPAPPAQQGYQGAASVNVPQQQAYGQMNANPYGYTYGYRPTVAGYTPGHVAPANPYPRQY